MKVFFRTYCSNCGGGFGPGPCGYSHCEDHTPAKQADRRASVAGELAVIASEIEAIAWESDLLRDIPEVAPDAMYLAAKYAELASEVWEERNDHPPGRLPHQITDTVRRALIPRIEAEIDRRDEMVRAEYASRQRAGLIDVNGVGATPGYYELLGGRREIPRHDSELPAWMRPEVLLMSTRAALITMWHFECPECGITDAELGPTDAHTFLCEVCLEEDRHVRLKRWPVDEESGALTAGHPA
jgi:hypothetical protein